MLLFNAHRLKRIIYSQYIIAFFFLSFLHVFDVAGVVGVRM